ncbi:MAG: BrnA antitoxin family protein [Gammaproteobacteria bacterium]|jgi:uncharacterized protein (DUF4415 family)
MKKTTKSSKKSDMKKYSFEELLKRPLKTDFKRLDEMEIKYDEDSPPTDEAFWKNAKIVDPGKKKSISLRLDPDVLEWFKHQDGRYQTLMNQVLRQYMNAHR